MGRILISDRLMVGVFFASFLLIGLWFLPDYGVSWDEDIQRKHGRVAWDYVNEVFGIDAQTLEPEENFRTYQYNFHGTLFQMVAHSFEEMLELHDYRQYHLLRHYGVFLLFFVASIFFYALLEGHFKSRRLALAGAMMLVLSPRIFGNAFFNTKDIVLMSFFIIATYSMIRFLSHRNFRWALFHAFASALAINARLIGIYIVLLTAAFIVVELVQTKEVRKREFIFSVLVYFSATAILTVALWPFLWENPVDNFVEAFQLLSQYSWEGDMRYFNAWVNSQDLPWHYALGWIHVSTPWVYLVFIWVGIVLVSTQFVKRLFQSNILYLNQKQRNTLVFAGLSVLPLAIVIGRDSVVYDSWRHLFFIYPALIVLAVCGFNFVSNSLRKFDHFFLRNLPQIALSISLLFNAVYIAMNHPLQHTYLNIPNGHLETKFDIDYWGVAYQTALREIADRDQRDTIRIAVMNYPGYANIAMLPEEIRGRFVHSKTYEEADYYLSNYRFKQELHRYMNDLYPLRQSSEVFTVNTWNANVIGVYKLGS